MAKSGTLQMPFLRIFCQSSPSFIFPLTPIVSMMRPLSVGSEGLTGGSGLMAVVGVGTGVVGIGVGF